MLTRIITAVICIPIAIFIVTQGGWLFGAAVLFLALVAWHEIASMAAGQDIHVYHLTSGLPVFLLVLAGCARQTRLFLPILTLGTLAILSEGLYKHCRQGEKNWERQTSFSLFALLYAGLLFAHFPLLRNSGLQPETWLGLSFTKGELLLWMVLLGTWASDTFAYFFGRAFGKHKFCSVSPKKSMEGAAAGFIGAVAVTAWIAASGMHYPWTEAIILGLGVGIFAPLGDLIESILKRSFAIKDSGKLFPGHGGVLDRFDSLLFAVPVIYYLLILFAGI